jgi:hypothetical protein
LPIVNFFGANALLDSGAFHHFVATFQPGGNAVLYVDGQPQGTVSLPSPFAYIDASPPLSIGRWGAAADQGELPDARDYLGRIDDVQIYNHALGASEVSYLYNNPGSTLASIPAVSEWGMIVMTGLLAAEGGSILHKRRARYEVAA